MIALNELPCAATSTFSPLIKRGLTSDRKDGSKEGRGSGRAESVLGGKEEGAREKRLCMGLGYAGIELWS